jgi:multidrug efflux pump subunit AcrA (membrane-fusion protein)
MLNISKKNPIEENIDQFSTVKNLANRPHYKILNKIILYVSLIGLVILFLPWTQNISGSGAVTTLKPDQRPQTIHSAIAGRIEKWYVNEGDYVNKGDTILFI